MTDQNEAADPIDGMIEEMRNKLRDASPSQLQEVIAEAVSDLVGVRYKCSISTVEYSDNLQQRGAEITLKLSQSTKDLLGL